MPNWSDNVSIIAVTTLARGSTSRGVLDLRTKYGSFIFNKIGRGGTNALSNGVVILVRRVLNNDGATAGAVHPFFTSQTSGTTAASSTTVNSDSNSGQSTLNVTSISGFSAGDYICIQDSGGGVTRLEWQRVSKTSAGVLTLDRNLTFTHSSVQADTIRSAADVFAPIFVDGGSLYEVIFDYGDDSTGDTVTISSLAQTFDS